jgi:hypothetical protein
MDKCEFLEICVFAKSGSDTGLKESYCDSNPLRCARFMVYQGSGEENVPEDLMPDEKIKAYAILAES